MSAPYPILCRWSGEAFEPASPHWKKYADLHFASDTLYPLEVREERSYASHRAYFAQINEAHHNLPDHLLQLLPTPEHLRRYALIKTGHCDERSIVCASRAEAVRVAAFVKPMDEFAVVVTQGAVVTVWTAKSQSFRAMNKEKFRESANAVLDFIPTLIGTTREALKEGSNA